MTPTQKSKKPQPKRFIVGITGASGVIYACRLIESLLLDPANEVHLIVTPAGQRVIAGELAPLKAGGSTGYSAKLGGRVGSRPADILKEARTGLKRVPLEGYLSLSAAQSSRLISHSFGDIGAGPASGTFRTEAMIVVPCSMNTLGAIAHGLSNNLLARAAAVTLKEGRKLIVVPRETPFTLIDLKNMASLAEAGGIILPANPGFYHRPQSIDQLVAYVTQKILDRLGLDFPGGIRWGEPE